MTRVVLVVWGFAAFGGMEQHVLQLALGLHRAGSEVVVISEMPVRRANVYGQQLRRAGIALHAAPRLAWLANAAVLGMHRRSGAERLIHGGGMLSRWLRRRLVRLTRNSQVDVLHVHGCRLGQSWLMAWAQSRGLPCVYTEHVDIAAAGGPLRPDAPQLVQAAGVIACVSDQARQSLASVLAVPRAIVVTGHIVADPLARMASGQRQPEQRQPGPRPHLEILCPARLAHHKGIDVLLRAFAASAAPHPYAQLTIAGGGPDSAMLQALAAKLKLGTAVRFAGALAPAQMSQALDRADIVVLPSRSEALPLALLEALACGKPVVATCVGGIPEMIVCGENGMLVAVDDVAGLAAALQQLIADPALRDRLGMAARKSFMDSRHHERRVIPEMLELYRDAQC